MEQQQQIEVLGEQIFAEMKGEKPGIFNRNYWQGKIMDWVMKDPSFKIDMFRFVDVLPQLKTSDQVSKHVREYLIKKDRHLSTMLEAALKAAASGITSGVASKAIRKNVTDMAERFIVGTDAQSAKRTLSQLHSQGIAFTVDLLGEMTLSEHEADLYQQKYLSLIEGLATEAKNWSHDLVIDEDNQGPIPRVNVSLKVTALDTQLKALDPSGAVERLKKRVLPIFLAAKKNRVFLNVDLEQWEFHQITYDLFEELLYHPELRDWPHFGIVVQAYLKNAKKDVERLLLLAKKRETPLTVRLVKGAYWDYEVVNAKQKGFEYPVFLNKVESDLNFEHLSTVLLDNHQHLKPAFGSHNLRSLTKAIVYAKQNAVPLSAFEIQMLFGMAEPERKVLRARGHRVRVYAPVGEMLPGMAYLVRRLLENTSNSGFLKLSHHQEVDVQSLLMPPKVNKSFQIEHQTPRTNAKEKSFENCAFLDFTREENRATFKAGIEKHETSIPYLVQPAVFGVNEQSEAAHTSVNPGKKDEIIGKVCFANQDQANKSVNAAYNAFPQWRDTALNKRIQLVERLASLLEEDRFELATLQTLEVGKPWAEADADVAEAIDFCRYYAHVAPGEIGTRKQGNVWGEDNTLIYQGRGPTVVIAPWNFPLAILCGMTVAALVSGNPVIIKPAEQSSVTAQFFFDRILKAGFAKDVAQFLPAKGEDVGAFLVSHPLVSQIAFTGSKEVGLQILQSASTTQKGQPQVKRVVCEMGGKNAIIVDDDADIDEAVTGVMHSIFGFAGQKCSACSRVLVVKSIYETFCQRLVEATKSLHITAATNPACTLGPVIDETSCNRLKKEIETAMQTEKVLYIGEVSQKGHFVPPALFEVKDSKSRLMQQEFFGPIAALMPVENFDSALDIASKTDFALTGAVYSRSPVNIEKAKAGFQVGNLYINRSSTGALVYRQPFGGFKMSGTGLKAGGPDYLLNFSDRRAITENTMRRGFTPELEN